MWPYVVRWFLSCSRIEFCKVRASVLIRWKISRISTGKTTQGKSNESLWNQFYAETKILVVVLIIFGHSMTGSNRAPNGQF